MSTPITLRPAVRAFAEQMEKALRRNDRKGGWHGCTGQYLFRRLRDELEELLGTGRTDLARVREAADVANFAMMIADNTGKLRGVNEDGSWGDLCG